LYHPINRINCPPLNKLNDIARLTLEFCLNQNINLTDDEIKQRFIQYIASNGYPLAGEWLWNRTVLVRPHVLSLTRCTVLEKPEILNVYVQNQAIDDRFVDGNFLSVNLPMSSQDAYDAYETATQLIANFYKILCAEVPKEILDEPEALNRYAVLRAYLDAQRSICLKVCPGCDGKPPSGADGIMHEDIDHFFPKSKHPFLSIHPLNLTPLCKDCNQTYKRNKDAILDDDTCVADVKTLQDIYHPYVTPARELTVVNLGTNPHHETHFNVESKLPAPQATARIHSLQYTLNLEVRWDWDLQQEYIQEHLWGYLTDASQDERKENENFQPDIAWLEDRLLSAVIYFDRGIGHISGYVAAFAYTNWVVRTLQEKTKLLTIVQNALNY
jgi:hypothetical protein